MNYNPILALLAGAGRGVEAIDERHQTSDLARQRQTSADEDRRMKQLQATYEFRKTMRDDGMRPMDQVNAELAGITDQSAQSLPITTTPTSTSIAGPSGGRRPDPAMLQLIQGAPTPSVTSATPADDRLGRALRVVAGAEDYTDPSGQTRQYAFDPTSTAKAREDAARLSRERATRDAETQQAEADMRKAAQALVDNGMAPTLEKAYAAVQAHKFAPELVRAPATERNIDPNSPEGIAAAAARARAVAAAEAPFKKDPAAMTPTQANQVKLQQSALLNMHRSIKALADAVRQDGTAILAGEHQTRLKALQTDAQIQYKEAANLGALSGPDMELVLSALGSATSPWSLVRGGAEGVLASLDVAEQSLRRRAETMKAVYGVDMPAGFSASSGGGEGGGDTATGPITLGGKPTISADQAAFLRDKKGWSDAQIRAQYEVKR